MADVILKQNDVDEFDDEVAMCLKYIWIVMYWVGKKN